MESSYIGGGWVMKNCEYVEYAFFVGNPQKFLTNWLLNKKNQGQILHNFLKKLFRKSCPAHAIVRHHIYYHLKVLNIGIRLTIICIYQYHHVLWIILKIIFSIVRIRPFHWHSSKFFMTPPTPYIIRTIIVKQSTLTFERSPPWFLQTHKLTRDRIAMIKCDNLFITV